MSEINELTGRVIGAAIEVHKRLGPGLLESAYQACLAAEMGKRGILFQRETNVPVYYDSLRPDSGYRLDFLVEDQVVLGADLPEARRLAGGSPDQLQRTLSR